MKKALIITLIVLAILAVLFAIFIIVNKNIFEDSTDITMTIKEGTLTKTSATIIIKGKDVSCGYDYNIEKKENDNWKSVTQIKGYFVPAVSCSSLIGKLDFNLDWTERYGELENGEYRIVKEVFTNDGDTELYAEFTIE